MRPCNFIISPAGGGSGGPSPKSPPPPTYTLPDDSSTGTLHCCTPSDAYRACQSHPCTIYLPWFPPLEVPRPVLLVALLLHTPHPAPTPSSYHTAALNHMCAGGEGEAAALDPPTPPLPTRSHEGTVIPPQLPCADADKVTRTYFLTNWNVALRSKPFRNQLRSAYA
jgi:hypothetical protein